MSKFKKSYIYILIIIFSVGIHSSDYSYIDLSESKKNLSYEIFKKLEKDHYLKKIDKKNFNKKYFDAILKRLDENKNLFTADEVQKYLKKSEIFTKNDFDIELAYELINLYFERLIMFSNFQIKLIEEDKFDFKKEDYLDIFYEDNQWQSNFFDLNNLWRLETKNDYLVIELAESSSLKPQSDLIKRYQNRIRRINQQKEEDIFSLAINILTNQFDPHSSYLSPRSAEDFDLNMSLKLNGIGALLGVEDDYTKIINLVPGGPAEKSGKINPEDRITKIRQIGSSNYTDVVGWRID